MIYEDEFEWDKDPRFFIFNEYLPNRINLHTKRLDLKNWIILDEPYCDQMELRADILSRHREEVFYTKITPATEMCKWELFELLVKHLSGRYPDKFELHSGYIRNKVLRQNVSILRNDEICDEDPLIRISRLTQEDWLILEWDDSSGKYLLTAGLFCFPCCQWLQNKFKERTDSSHQLNNGFLTKVDDLVQTLVQKLKPENPVWRANWGIHNNLKNVLDLITPKRNKGVSVYDKKRTGKELILREEYQTIRKLPKTNCVVFSIHYFQRYIEEFKHLPLSDCIGLLNALEGLNEEMKAHKGVEFWGDALSEYLRSVIHRRQCNIVGRMRSYVTSYWWFAAIGFSLGSLMLFKMVFEIYFK